MHVRFLVLGATTVLPSKDHRALHPTWYLEGDNVGKESFVLRFLGQTVRTQRILILLPTGNGKGSGQAVRRVAHGLTGGELGHRGQLGGRHREQVRCATPRIAWCLWKT